MQTVRYHLAHEKPNKEQMMEAFMPVCFSQLVPGSLACVVTGQPPKCVSLSSFLLGMNRNPPLLLYELGCKLTTAVWDFFFHKKH